MHRFLLIILGIQRTADINVFYFEGMYLKIHGPKLNKGVGTVFHIRTLDMLIGVWHFTSRRFVPKSVLIIVLCFICK